MNRQNGEPSPEERKRIVDDAIAHSGLDKQEPLTLRQQIMSRAWGVNQIVQQQVRPVMKEIKQRGSYEPLAAQDFVYKLYLEHYNKWSKDDLVQVMSMMQSGMAMQDIEKYMES